MEREEGAAVTGDILPAGGIAHPENAMITAAESESIAPAQLWRDYLSSWIGGSRGYFLASSVRGGEARMAGMQEQGLEQGGRP